MLRELIATFAFFKSRDDDDFVDRLHYFFTPNLLLAMAMLISFKQFGGRPIECLCPEMYPGGWEQYAENYCWSQDTYYVRHSQKVVPSDKLERYPQKVSYYQWVPFFLVIEAISFVVPVVFYRLFAEHSGIRVENIVSMAIDKNNVRPEIRKNTITIVATHLENALKFHRRVKKRNITPHRILRCLNLPYNSCYVTVMYLTTKSLFLLNTVAQWVLMNIFLGTDQYAYYGWGALRGIINGSTWEHSGVFPRVTLCDFDIRQMGSNVQQHTIQCVLVINLFNEKIFAFLWVWYLVLTLLTLASFLYWSILMIFPNFSRWFVSRHMELCEMPFDTNSSRNDIYEFVHSYLRMDGVFVLRMITMHTGVIFGTDVILKLWRRYFGIEEPEEKKKKGKKRKEIPTVGESPTKKASPKKDGDDEPSSGRRMSNTPDNSAIMRRRGSKQPDSKLALDDSVLVVKSVSEYDICEATGEKVPLLDQPDGSTPAKGASSSARSSPSKKGPPVAPKPGGLGNIDKLPETVMSPISYGPKAARSNPAWGVDLHTNGEQSTNVMELQVNNNTSTAISKPGKRDTSV